MGCAMLSNNEIKEIMTIGWVLPQGFKVEIETEENKTDKIHEVTYAREKIAIAFILIAYLAIGIIEKL